MINENEKVQKRILIRFYFVLLFSPSTLRRNTRACRHFTQAWQWCKGCATIPASSQLPKIHPTQHPLICIINALIVPRGHRRVSVKRVAFQFANGSALSRNESNRYAWWYGWRVMAQQAFVNWTPRIKIHDRSPARVTVPKKIDWSHWLFPHHNSQHLIRSGAATHN